VSGGTRRCGDCGKVAEIQRRARDGFPDLCRRCTERLHAAGDLPRVRGRMRRERICSCCKKVKKVGYTAKEARGELCAPCYATLVDRGKLPGRRCGGCGKERLIVRGGRAGEPDLCGGCYRAPDDICTVCARRRPCTYAGTERAICITCQRRQNRRPCGECGRSTMIERRIDGQLICQACWTRRLNARAVCTACGQLARPAKSARNRGLCEDCADDPLAAPCARCGHRGRNRHRELCARCTLGDHLDALTANAAPGRAEAMADYLTALRASTTPESVLHWLIHRDAAQRLTELLDGRLELSHEALDTAGSEQSTRFLRAALVRHGALHERDDDETRLAATLARQLQRLSDGAERRTLRRYATWQVTSDLLHRKHQGRARPYSVRGAQAKIRAAAHFLHHLHEHGIPLGEVSQLQVDAWLAAGAPAHHYLQPFLTWAHKEGLVSQLEVPRPALQTSSRLLTDDERLPLVRRLLDDEALDLRDRVAGSLVLLLAQPVTRISQLTDADILDGDAGAVLLALGRHPFPLPPQLGALICRLRDEAPGLASTAHTDERWLFRGLRLDKPMSPDRLRIRLARVGIRGRAARLSAARPLAQQLPPQVLADVLGYSMKAALSLAETHRTADSAYIAAQRRAALRVDHGHVSARRGDSARR
jgi:hypothetical protein